MSLSLSTRQARHLRGLAHHLDPVVRVGGAGVTEAVIAATDVELEIHELIKVRVDGDRVEVREAASALSQGTRAGVAQIIGKIVVLYRRRRKKPTITLPG